MQYTINNTQSSVVNVKGFYLLLYSTTLKDTFCFHPSIYNILSDLFQ